MNKKQLLKHLKEEVYCRLMQSKTHQVGVFAVRKIPKGTNPFKKAWSGKYIPFKKSELLNLPKGVLQMIKDFGAIEDDEIYISEDGLNDMDISFFVNHSKKPNLTLVKNEDKFVTNRVIIEGEELTIDYSTYSEEWK